ncbi:hypothetical protein ONZ45_g6797 [Pleurotus djamor]|nr:hypothetical protein ONZ45_g6797 [Pleurotus djamor]
MKARGVLLLVLGLCPVAQIVFAANIIQPMEQSFLFQWDKPSELPIPVTEQCERIHITWGRDGATGSICSIQADGLRYVGTFHIPLRLPNEILLSGPWKTPFIIDAGVGLEFDWDVSFPPGTMYVICMFDNNGNSGGCQDRHTVIKNSTVASPTCQDIAFPPVLGVQGYGPNGALSDHGWIPQCSDIALQPVAGNATPPFTAYIAPPLRPPYKIVSHDFGFINWTVTLSDGFAFFLSVESSDGLMCSRTAA